MALDLTALADYTNENKLPLIRKSILGGKTLSLINLQADIKTAAAINILESDAVFQAGACGWNASGTTTLTQRVLTVSPIKQNEALCPDDLEAKYTQTMLKAGSYNEDIGFEQLYAEEKATKSAAAIETLAWQGDTLSATGNLAICDGFVKRIDAEANVVTGTILALTSATIVSAVNEMVAAIPVDVVASTDLVLFMEHSVYRIYAAALRDANLFHYDGKEGADFEMIIPGTNVKAVAVTGLTGTSRIFLAEASNLYVGSDLLNDAEDFKIFFSEDNDEVRFKQKLKIGFQMAFPERIVSN